MKKMHKKGFLAGVLVDIMSYFVFILIVVIFFLIFSFGKAEVQLIASDVEDLSQSTILLNFLRTPTGNGNIADQIIEALTVKPELVAQVELNAKRFLSLNYIDPFFWELVVYNNKGKKIMTLTQKAYASEWFDARAPSTPPAGIIIPDKQGKLYNVTLTKWKD